MKKGSNEYIASEDEAFQPDVDCFNRLEEILENHVLVQLMEQQVKEEALGLKEAKAYYETLEKAD